LPSCYLCLFTNRLSLIQLRYQQSYSFYCLLVICVYSPIGCRLSSLDISNSMHSIAFLLFVSILQSVVAHPAYIPAILCILLPACYLCLFSNRLSLIQLRFPQSYAFYCLLVICVYSPIGCRLSSLDISNPMHSIAY
jgi:hypothetical protein